MKIRVNNIECRFSQSRYEFVKWQPNHYYGKREEYIAEGWQSDGGFLRRNNTSIQESIFNSPETCYTIATLKYDADEMCCDMNTVGARLLQLDETDRKDFFAVYELAEERIREENQMYDDVEF
jgi:hypothetical protein